MPETDTGAASVDIGSLITPPAGMVQGLTDLARDRSAQTDKITTGIDRDIDQDMSTVRRREAASAATGMEAAQYPKWNAEEEHKKFQTDPIEAFGSVGSVFGILASAFTHAPLENALNASAAAMNAIKAGDEKAYERAEKAWKDNWNLVVKRHEIMREGYQDATTLMKTNMAAGEAKLKTLAMRFDDKKTLMMLENGMSDDVFKTMDARNKSIESGIKAFDAIQEGGAQATKRRLQDSMYDRMRQGNEAVQDPMQRAAADFSAFQTVYGVEKDGTTQQAMISLYGKAMKEFQDGKRPSPTPTDDEITKLKRDLSPYGHSAGASGNANLTESRQQAASAARERARLTEETDESGKPKWTDKEIDEKVEEYRSGLKAKAAAPSGNKVDQLKSRVNQIKYSSEAIDKVEALLKKHNALTGLGGKISRPGETIASIFGSNETDRHEFESLVSEIKEWAPRILTDSQGRPLSAEAGNIDKVVRGLNLGDTTKITAERLLQLKKLYQQMSTDTETRMKGGSGSAPAKAAPAPSGPMPWQRDPIKQKVSMAGDVSDPNFWMEASS